MGIKYLTTPVSKIKSFIFLTLVSLCVLFINIPFAHASTGINISGVTLNKSNWTFTVTGSNLPILTPDPDIPGDYSNFRAWYRTGSTSGDGWGWGDGTTSYDGYGVQVLVNTSSELEFKLDTTPPDSTALFNICLSPANTTDSWSSDITTQYDASTDQWVPVTTPTVGTTGSSGNYTVSWSGLGTYVNTGDVLSVGATSSGGTSFYPYMTITQPSGSESLSLFNGYSQSAVNVVSWSVLSSSGGSSVYPTSGTVTLTTPTSSGSGKSIRSLVNINAGELSLTAPSVSKAFPAVILNGSAQTISASLSNLTIVDATGTMNGWHVDVSASPFTEQSPTGGFASGTSAKTLPSGSLQLGTSGGGITADTGSLPVGSGGPLFEESGDPIDTSTPVALVQSQSGSGAGTYSVSFPSDALKLTLDPATTMLDSVNYPNEPTPYTTTITFTLSSAP